MDKLFRQVSVKERLPENNGGIIAICSPEDGLQQLYFKDGEFLDPMDDHPMKVTAWLEEVELPNYEDTRKARDAYSYSYLDPFRWGWKYGVKHILSKLKGEKNE
jgi:hypothetical protein